MNKKYKTQFQIYFQIQTEQEKVKNNVLNILDNQQGQKLRKTYQRKKIWFSKRTCKNEFNIKFIYSVVLEN